MSPSGSQLILSPTRKLFSASLRTLGSSLRRHNWTASMSSGIISPSLPHREVNKHTQKHTKNMSWGDTDIDQHTLLFIKTSMPAVVILVKNDVMSMAWWLSRNIQYCVVKPCYSGIQLFYKLQNIKLHYLLYIFIVKDRWYIEYI